MQSYWGIDHGDVISKKAPAERWYGTRDSSYNSRKENVKGGAVGGALGAGGVAGAVGAYGGRQMGRFNSTFGGRHLKQATQAKNVARGGRVGALKGAAILGGLGVAGGAAYGSAIGAVLPHKDSRGSAARRRFQDTRYQNKQAYKKQNKAAESRFYRDLSKS